MSTDGAPLSDCPAALGYAMRIRPEEEADGARRKAGKKDKIERKGEERTLQLLQRFPTRPLPFLISVGCKPIMRRCSAFLSSPARIRTAFIPSQIWVGCEVSG